MRTSPCTPVAPADFALPLRGRMARVLLCLAALSPLAAQGDDETAEDEKAARLESFKRAAAEYELAVDASPPVPLTRRPDPLLRWTNPLRKTGDGAVFLWTGDGRPQAVMCIYTYGETGIDHEFQSLSEQPLTMKRDGMTVWNPQSAGVQWQPLPDAPAPAAAAPLRMSQMRAFARRFSALLGRERRQEARLLSQPLIRYGDEDGPVVDGAIFALVQGTDPEVLVLFEAAREDGKIAWRYALARMTTVFVEVRYQDDVVWTVQPCWNRQPDTHGTYITFVGRREPSP